MSAKYMTTEDAEIRRMLSLMCRGCGKVFLYDQRTDRQVDEVADRAFVVCPCGKEFTLGIGGVNAQAELARR